MTGWKKKCFFYSDPLNSYIYSYINILTGRVTFYYDGSYWKHLFTQPANNWFVIVGKKKYIKLLSIIQIILKNKDLRVWFDIGTKNIHIIIIIINYRLYKWRMINFYVSTVFRGPLVYRISGNTKDGQW